MAAIGGLHGKPEGHLLAVSLAGKYGQRQWVAGSSPAASWGRAVRHGRRYCARRSTPACALWSASRVSSTVSSTVVDSDRNLPLPVRVSTIPAVAVLSGASARA